MTDTCRLCGTLAELRKSHILPEFLYRPLYDEKHRYFVVNADSNLDRLLQRGLAEKLLCAACEHRFSRYEKYAAETMNGRLGHHYRKVGGRIVMSGIDYSLFKLFQLSILWRGAVSSLDFFRLVSLGPQEPRLKQMLLSDDPGRPHEFGCAVVFATERGENINDTLFNPEPMRWSGRRIIKFFFAGSAWLFYCDKRPAPPYLQKLFLQVDGTLTDLYGDLAEAHVYSGVAKRDARRLRL